MKKKTLSAKYQYFTDKVIELLSNSEEPLRINEISVRLSIKSDTPEHDLLKKAIVNLCSQQVIKKLPRRRFALIDFDASSVITGKVEIRNGQGWVESGTPEYPEIIIKRRHLLTALDGDTVQCRILGLRKGKKPHAEVIKVIERSVLPIVGTVDYDGEFFFLIPDDIKHYVDFLIPNQRLNGATEGDKVSSKLIAWDDPEKSPKVEVLEIIGKSGEPKVEFESLCDEYSLPKCFPKEVESEAYKFSEANIANVTARLDFRNEVVITIDPEDAKDFDDGLSLSYAENGNYILGVHIADVSYFVEENSEIDIEARKRGTSVYLVDRVVPMLPEELSNNLCSLKPGLDRLAFSVFMEVTKSGTIKSYEIKETIIQNKRRFTYKEAQLVIDTGIGDYPELISDLHKLASQLRKKRFAGGGIDFRTTEVRFRLDEEKNPIEAYLNSQTDATSLVEESMLAANRTIASHIKKLRKSTTSKKSLPFMYRIHDEPDPGNLKTAMKFLAPIIKKLKFKELKSKDINSILGSIKNEEERHIANEILIRSMSKAIYSTQNSGHYGLGFAEYTHFTSPIRRYPDLIIHRTLKEYLTSRVSPAREKFLLLLLKDAAKTSSDTERRAMDIERQSIKLAHAILLKNRIGDVFEGMVTGVMNFGIFIMIDELYSEGLLHIRDMTDDFYIHDEDNFRLIGRRTGKTYYFGKRLRVVVRNVNLEKRTVDFRMALDNE
ncbi:MAG: Exoribonuclease [Ignavibacteria bacterium]|nr:Exoribonuclease [Ignavibacteria bacterium]